MTSLASITHHPDCPDCPLSTRGLCALLRPEAQQRLAEGAVTRDYRANASICDGAGPPGFVGLLISGYLRIQRFSIDGRRQIITLLTAGDLVGEGSLNGEGCQIEAATPARICRFDRRVFDRLLDDDHGMRRAVYGLRLAKLEQLRWLTWSLGALGAEERICAFLAMATKHMPFAPLPAGGGILTVDLPRADMADLMGTSVESISRITNSLAARGVIRIHDARHFEVPDVGLLAKMGRLGAMFETVTFAASRGPRKCALPGITAARIAALRPIAGPAGIAAGLGGFAPLSAAPLPVESRQ